ncbi:MAG: DNRLRE domain-containing protein, partial [Clostridiales bacterium]|nr:DNRLRE domain-containing protein [Clostridiales bacterium]
PPESDPEQEDYIGPTSSDKVIYSSRDTYISEDDVEQNINFAHQDKLRVYGGKWSKQKSAILRFDIPKNDIYSVKLQITVIAVEEVSVSKPQIIDVSIISNHYLIDEITWNTFNHSQQKIKIGNIIVTGAGTYTLELKDYVADQIKQTAITLSLLLEDTQINSIAKTEIGSYENPNNEPRLNLIKRGDSAEPGLMFEPTDDTYLLSSASNGFSDVIWAKSSGTNHVIRGFIRFDLATLQEEIDTAYLYLYFIGKETPNTEGFSLRVSNFNDWDESSLSWQSTPHPNNYIINDLTQIIPVSNEGVWIKIDIKHILTNPNFVDKLYTFGIYPSKSDAGVIFASKESLNSPYIAINQVEGETPQYKVSIDIVNGKGGDVFISNTTVFKNENLTVLIKPEYDYFIEYVKINGQKIDFSDYLIVISDINNDISIEVKFNKQNLLMASFSTYTREDMPNTAYDKDEFFAVKTTLTGTNSRIGYLCFKNLNEDVLSNKVIFRIMGYKAVELGSKAMPIGVYAFSDGAKWLENGITWNNQPINDLFYKGKVQDVAGVSASAGLKSGTKLGVLNAISLTWYELDITEYVHALVIAGIHDFGITLVDECNDGAPRFEFYSTMAAQEYRPHLRLDPADKFELETVKITVDTGDYGTVFGQGEVIIGYDYEIFIICDAGYKISQAIVNGQVVNVIRNKILL